MSPSATIDAIVSRVESDLIAVRRTIHQHPELAFEEHETAKLVAARLRALGLDVRTGIGRTGVVAVVEGSRPGPTIGVRADMDALPIEEASGVPFASRIPGRMHACGHDAHTAIALGVAHVFTAMRDDLPGRVKLIFQPAEETLSGAPAMIADGVLEDPPMDAIIGFHNWPAVDTGFVGYYPAEVMASSDAFDIVLRGKAGHAAHPHTGVDALVGAAQLVAQLQTIVSREVAPAIPAVLTIGQLEAGTVRNVIPARAVLKGTVRTLDPTASGQIEAAVRRITAGVCATLRLDHDIQWVRQTPVLRNDVAVLATVLESVRDTIGGDRIVDLGRPTMGSEDFAWFAERVPAAHLRFGSRIEGLATAVHHANYDCNEATIGFGVRTIAHAVLRLLDREQPA
jgi:hippurate hydrolase